MHCIFALVISCAFCSLVNQNELTQTIGRYFNPLIDNQSLPFSSWNQNNYNLTNLTVEILGAIEAGYKMDDTTMNTNTDYELENLLQIHSFKESIIMTFVNQIKIIRKSKKTLNYILKFLQEANIQEDKMNRLIEDRSYKANLIEKLETCKHMLVENHTCTNICKSSCEGLIESLSLKNATKPTKTTKPATTAKPSKTTKHTKTAKSTKTTKPAGTTPNPLYSQKLNDTSQTNQNTDKKNMTQNYIIDIIIAIYLYNAEKLDIEKQIKDLKYNKLKENIIMQENINTRLREIKHNDNAIKNIMDIISRYLKKDKDVINYDEYVLIQLILEYAGKERIIEFYNRGKTSKQSYDNEEQNETHRSNNAQIVNSSIIGLFLLTMIIFVFQRLF